MKTIFLVIAILFNTASVFANTANISGISYSVSIHEASSYIGNSFFECYFTTYDGDRYSVPLYDYSGGYYYYSQELKKVGSLYKMDYFLIVDGYIDDYGEISINLGSTDTNSNGIDDFCELSLSSDNSVSGNWYSHDGTDGGLDGYMSRNANSHRGTYSLTAHDTYVGDLSLSGDFYVGTVSGTFDYFEKEKTISITYSSTWSSPAPSETLKTTYEIPDQDRIRVNAKGIFPSTVFTRDGNTYSAVVELTDGEPTTSWADYQKWLIHIEDTNDSDGDGIPDLSDPTAPPKTKAMPWLQMLLDD
jgi:hypothetical protein